LNLIRVMPAKGQDNSMQTSTFLAKLIGPIMVIVAVGVLMNRKSLDTLAREILGSHALLFLLGFLDLASGLAIVLVHNVWVADWRVIITLLGWLLLVRGAVRILIPEQIKPFGTKMLRNPNVVTGSLAVTLVVGLVLSYFGYTRLAS
jgi:hypothetical protein